MAHRIIRQVSLAILIFPIALIGLRMSGPAAQTVPTGAELKIAGAVSTPLTLTVADLKKMPRKTLTVMNPHEKKQETYEGVLLEDLLQKAGVPHGEQLRGAAMVSYVLAEAEDGYRVTFSLAELDSAFLNCEVIVADTMDGLPLGAKQGPFKLVAPHEKRPARWIRMVKSITIVGPTAKERRDLPIPPQSSS